MDHFIESKATLTIEKATLLISVNPNNSGELNNALDVVLCDASGAAILAWVAEFPKGGSWSVELGKISLAFTMNGEFPPLGAAQGGAQGGAQGALGAAELGAELGAQGAQVER